MQTKPPNPQLLKVPKCSSQILKINTEIFNLCIAINIVSNNNFLVSASILTEQLLDY
jgi:hypothetical protein